MDFERVYNNGQHCNVVRQFLNKYVIQGGESKRQQVDADRNRIIDKKLKVIEHFINLKSKSKKQT